MYTYAAVCDIGPVSATNDDRVLIEKQLIGDDEVSGEIQNDCFLAAICDGVGGMAKGYEAAERTLEHLKELNVPGMERNDIRKVIENANRNVIAKQNEMGCNNGMRTTLVAIYYDGDVYYVINAGDSRCYRYRNGMLELLSRDHSVVQNMIDAGEITEEEARVHPKRNIITKCIGDEERVNARIIEHVDDSIVGDIYVLCSDGISDCLTDEQLASVIARNFESDLLSLSKELVREAIQFGSGDNISVCLIRKEK